MPAIETDKRGGGARSPSFASRHRCPRRHSPRRRSPPPPSNARAVSHRPPKSQTQCRRSSSPIVPQQTIVPVLGSDRRYQVLYELQLVNTLGRPADLRSVEVLDAGNGRSLLTLSAAEIVKGDYLHTLDRHSPRAHRLHRSRGSAIMAITTWPSGPQATAIPICAMVSCAATKSTFTMLLCVPSACSPVGSGACLSHFAPNMDRRRAWSCGVSHIRLNALSRARNSRIVEISPGHDRSVSARLHLGLEVDTRTG